MTFLATPAKRLSVFRYLIPAPYGDNALPDRVCKEIYTEQQRADVLIGFVQAALCLVFSLLYFFARKTHPAEAPFDPVPWALAVYAIATAVRIALARRRRLPDALQALSVAIDMTLLFGLIWSFHIEYRQVPAFYLKAPTLLYVFIFIALRALRFDARYVLLAGAFGAAGWLLLVLYAAMGGPDWMPTTHDYVAYMTSAVILWGAEIDKIISILLVTTLIAAAVARSRYLLFRAVTEAQAAIELKRFFEADIAQRITTAPTPVRPGEGEIRDAAILFVDLRGFTTLSRQMDANSLVALLGEYHTRFVPIIQEHGGSIDKFLGDGILASFGAVCANETYAADAVRTIDALTNAARRWREERQVRGAPVVEVGAAAATGPVLFGAIGGPARLEYTVVGEPVNLAAKLEKHTKVAGVQALTTADAHKLAVHQGYPPGPPVLRRPREHVAGLDAPIDLVVLAP